MQEGHHTSVPENRESIRKSVLEKPHKRTLEGVQENRHRTSYHITANAYALLNLE